jgi:hypothetical protein
MCGALNGSSPSSERRGTTAASTVRRETGNDQLPSIYEQFMKLPWLKNAMTPIESTRLRQSTKTQEHCSGALPIGS